MYTRLLNILLAVAISITCGLLVRHYLLGVYYVQSSSMQPTILPGNIIVTFKSRLLTTKIPSRNDIIVFKLPAQNAERTFGKAAAGEITIKRIVALPGDTVIVSNGILKVNGNMVNLLAQRAGLLVSGNSGIPSLSVFPNDTTITKWTLTNFGPLVVPRKGYSFAFNSLTHLIYKDVVETEEPGRFNSRDDSFTLSRYVVKEDYLFVCGDNVSYSLDSRYWGFLPSKAVTSNLWFSIRIWPPRVSFPK